MIKKIEKSSDKLEVLRKVVNFLSYRDRSESEVLARLKLYTDHEDVMNYVMDYLHKLELLDDAKFAARWVKSRQSSRSIQVLRHELKAKGIDSEVINKSLPSSDRGALLALMNKRKRDDKAKLFRYCLGKGFSYDLVKEVFRELTS